MPKGNLISNYHIDEESISYKQITIDIEDRDSRQYIPQTVHKIFTKNQDGPSTLSVHINDGRYFVLTGNTTKNENGLYQKRSSGNKQITLDKDYFFLDVSSEFNRAVYLNNTKNTFPVNFNKVLCGTSFSTASNTTKNIFNIPVAYSRPMLVNTNVIGVSQSNNDLFNGDYKSLFYNTQGTSIIRLKNFSQVTLRTDPLNFNLPTIKFGTSMGISGGTIELVTNNSFGISWYVKSELLF